MKDKLNQMWKEASLRERWMIGGGMGLLLLVVLYFYIWQPMDKDRKKMRASLPQLRASAAQIRISAAEVAKLKALPASASTGGDGIRNIIETSAETFKLRDSLGQVSLDGNERVNLTMTTVPFDTWVRWLGQLQEQSHLRLESCHVEALPQPGMVNIKAVLAGKVG